MSYEIVHRENFESFQIELATEPEWDAPDWDFEEGEKQKLLEDIESGKVLWFVARVRAYKAGVLLATDYLGGCCYNSVKDFLDVHGYYGDMRRTVVDAARAKLAELTKGE